MNVRLKKLQTLTNKMTEDSHSSLTSFKDRLTSPQTPFLSNLLENAQKTIIKATSQDRDSSEQKIVNNTFETDPTN